MKKFVYLSHNQFIKNHLFSQSIIMFLAVVMMLLNTGCSQKVFHPSPPAVNKIRKNLPSLKIGILPLQNFQNQQRMIKQFDSYLEKFLGRTVDIQLAKNYDEAVNWLVEEKVDIAYLGPLTYLEALDRGAKIEPLVASIDKNTGQPWYRACIIIKSDSSIHSLSDLKGRRVAFIDKLSTAGYLMPLAAFKKLNIDPNQDFKKFIYTGSHTKSMEALENGIVDAIATHIPFYTKQKRMGKFPQNSRILWESDPMPQFPVVVLKKLPPELIKQLKQAFINTPDGIEDINGTESAGYTLVSASDYESIQQIRKDLNLISSPSK
ncbi:phosphate/phosphite/phosphonate ABC transporter substrate-binding protein [Anabaena sp. UHCC 0187]|nr:phosphate/phosphite/phosphonate ABC transporter substrate-binding protein [Anabaena sp. UHCC 0187]